MSGTRAEERRPRHAGERPGLDESAIRELDLSLRRYVSQLVRDVHEVDDVVQETLTRVLTVERRLDAPAITGYALVVARNLVRDRHRQAVRHRRREPDLVDHRAEPPPDEAVIAAEERAALRTALASLPPAQRDLLLAHDLDGHPLASLSDRDDGSGAPALAAQLTRTRARVRVDYLVARRRDPLPTDRCRPVLLALSAGDRRRQDTLHAGSHLLRCPACSALAPALLERRRSLAAVLPFAPVALFTKGWTSLSRTWQAMTATAVAAGAAVVVALAVAPSTGSPPPTDLMGPHGPLLAQRHSLARDEGGAVRATYVPVLAVPADEGFWVGHGRARIWAELPGDRESQQRVRAGQRVSFRGTVVANGRNYERRMGLTPGEGARELVRQRFHIDVDRETLTIRR